MKNYFRRTDPETGEMVNDPAQLAELNKDADIWNPNFTYGYLHSWVVEDGSFLRLNTVDARVYPAGKSDKEDWH